MTVLIFIIATEKYIRFFPKLKKTIQQYFLTDYKKVFYVFTNHDLENEVDVIYDKIFPLPMIASNIVVDDFLLILLYSQ